MPTSTTTVFDWPMGKKAATSSSGISTKSSRVSVWVKKTLSTYMPRTPRLKFTPPDPHGMLYRFKVGALGCDSVLISSVDGSVEADCSWACNAKVKIAQSHTAASRELEFIRKQFTASKDAPPT